METFNKIYSGNLTRHAKNIIGNYYIFEFKYNGENGEIILKHVVFKRNNNGKCKEIKPRIDGQIKMTVDGKEHYITPDVWYYQMCRDRGDFSNRFNLKPISLLLENYEVDFYGNIYHMKRPKTVLTYNGMSFRFGLLTINGPETYVRMKFLSENSESCHEILFSADLKEAWNEGFIKPRIIKENHVIVRRKIENMFSKIINIYRFAKGLNNGHVEYFIDKLSFNNQFILSDTLINFTNQLLPQDNEMNLKRYNLHNSYNGKVCDKKIVNHEGIDKVMFTVSDYIGGRNGGYHIDRWVSLDDIMGFDAKFIEIV